MSKMSNESLKWRLIFQEYNDPFLNIALDEVLFQQVLKNNSLNILRFWKSLPCCVIGRHQEVSQEINENYCKKEGIPIIRRISGGGSVYLDMGCLNFSLIFKDDNILHSIELIDSYSKILDPIIKALQSLSFNVEFITPNSIFIDGKKISGSSQFRRGKHVLHHGTLLLYSNQKQLHECLNSNVEVKYKKAVKSMKFETTNLFDTEGQTNTDFDIELAIGLAFKQEFKLTFKIDSIKSEEIEITKNLITEKYSSINWAHHSRFLKKQIS